MKNNIILKSETYGDESYLITSFVTNRKRTAFIKEVERLCRTSDIYKRWLSFIKGTLGQDFKCYKRGYEPSICEIEVHHHPLTLFDFADLATGELLQNTNGITLFDVADQVMRWHFENFVGFVPLSKTVHQMYHKRALQIPIDIVEGKWRKFINDHVDGVDENLASKVELLASINIGNLSGDDIEWIIKERQYKPISDVPVDNCPNCINKIKKLCDEINKCLSYEE